MKRWLDVHGVGFNATPLIWGGILMSLLASPVRADQQTKTAPNTNQTQAVSATASLDFIINIDKFIFFRVGAGSGFTGSASGVGPASSGSIDTITFNAVPSIPSGGTAPVNGNRTPVNWNGGIPTFSAASTALGVEVRSNAGQVRIWANPSTVLTSGSNTIPMSQIGITSSDTNFPAPLVPNSGNGTAVLVTPGGTGTAAAPALLTYRTANWTFAYNALASPAAGTYSGQITFTASSP